MRQLFKRSALGGTVVSVLVLLSSLLLVLGVALKVRGQEFDSGQDLNVKTPSTFRRETILNRTMVLGEAPTYRNPCCRQTSTSST